MRERERERVDAESVQEMAKIKATKAAPKAAPP